MIFVTWTRTVAAVALAGTMLVGCGDDGGSAVDAGASSDATDTNASAPSPRTEASATSSASVSAPAGECSPPTANVVYTAGTATLTVANGPVAGDYELTADLERPDDNAYVTDYGKYLVGNWQGEGLEDVEDLPKLQVSMADEGAGACQGPPIVRIYLPYTAYEDKDSVACTGSLDSLTATAATGRFECTGVARTFGSREPEALDASGTFSLSS